MSKRLVIAGLVAAVSALISRAQVPTALSGTKISSLRDQYVKSFRALYNDDPYPRLIHIGDQQAKQVAKICLDILHSGILVLLENDGDDAGTIKKGIDTIQGEYAVTADSADFTNVPFADPFALNGQDGVTIGYLSGDAPYDQPMLEFYTRREGGWGLRASAGEEYQRHTFFVAKLPSPLAGQVWYLTWGHEIGDTGTRLAVRLYAFDGTTVRTVWMRDGLVMGSVTVSGSKVTLEHEYAYHSNEPRVTETLYVTPNGLE